MSDALHDFLTAAWQTAALFWPLYVAFAAILLAIGTTFLKLCIRDWKQKSARKAPHLRVYDQETEPAWMPSSPECRRAYREYHRQHRARRSIA